MKHLRLLSLLLTASAMAVANGNMSTATTSTGGGGTITIVTPIKVQTIQNLSFGAIVIDKTHWSPGFMSIDPDGNVCTLTGGGTSLFKGAGRLPTAAQFSVTGEPGYPFLFDTPPFGLALKDNVPLTGFMKIVPNYVVVDGLAVGTIGHPAIIKVGGQLIIDNPSPGIWSGTFNARVNYL